MTICNDAIHIRRFLLILQVVELQLMILLSESMQKFRFTVTDYRRITRSMLYFFVAMLPILFIVLYLLKTHRDIYFIIATFIAAIVVLAVYFGVVKYAMIYDSEFMIDEKGINENNLKNGKHFEFNWDKVESIKISNTKHVADVREYLTIKFNNSNHTISISEDDESDIRDLFQSFKTQLIENMTKQGYQSKIEITD
jgi:hypothetical protein